MSKLFSKPAKVLVCWLYECLWPIIVASLNDSFRIFMQNCVLIQYYWHQVTSSSSSISRIVVIAADLNLNLIVLMWSIRPQLREKKFFERGLKLKEMIYKTTFRKEIFPNFLFCDQKSPPKFENQSSPNPPLWHLYRSTLGCRGPTRYEKSPNT